MAASKEEHHVIEGTAEEVATELAVAAPAPPPATLFRTDDPVQVLARATEVADALKSVIEQRGLWADISGKQHVLVEGWLTLGSMLGVTAICEWTRPVENGWEARVEAKTLDGRTIGAAEAMCLKTERRWKRTDDFAIRSMAQTRATSKALASVLRFVVTLAGYEGTPAEEIDGQPSQAPRSETSAAKAPASVSLDDKTVKRVLDGFKAVGCSYADIATILGAVGAEAQAINRADSVAKAVRALDEDQAAKVIVELDRRATS